MRNVLVVGGAKAIVEGNLQRKLRGFNLHVKWHISGMGGAPVTSIPDACQGVLFIRDMLSHSLFDRMQKEARKRELPMAAIPRKWSNAEIILRRQGLLDPVPEALSTLADEAPKVPPPVEAPKVESSGPDFAESHPVLVQYTDGHRWVPMKELLNSGLVKFPEAPKVIETPKVIAALKTIGDQLESEHKKTIEAPKTPKVIESPKTTPKTIEDVVHFVELLAEEDPDKVSVPCLKTFLTDLGYPSDVVEEHATHGVVHIFNRWRSDVAFRSSCMLGWAIQRVLRVLNQKEIWPGQVQIFDESRELFGVAITPEILVKARVTVLGDWAGAFDPLHVVVHAVQKAMPRLSRLGDAKMYLLNLMEQGLVPSLETHRGRRLTSVLAFQQYWLHESMATDLQPYWWLKARLRTPGVTQAQRSPVNAPLSGGGVEPEPVALIPEPEPVALIQPTDPPDVEVGQAQEAQREILPVFHPQHHPDTLVPEEPPAALTTPDDLLALASLLEDRMRQNLETALKPILDRLDVLSAQLQERVTLAEVISQARSLLRLPLR